MALALALAAAAIACRRGDEGGEPKTGAAPRGATPPPRPAAKPGDLLWAARLGGPADEVVHDVAAAPDGAVIVSGSTEGGGWLARGGFVARFEPGGTLAWARETVGGDALAAAPDGGAIVMGGEPAGLVPAGPMPAGLVIDRFDAGGQRLWRKSASRSGAARRGATVSQIAPTGDGGWIAVGALGPPSQGGGHETFGEGKAALTLATDDAWAGWIGRFGADGAPAWVRLVPRTTAAGCFAIAGVAADGSSAVVCRFDGRTPDERSGTYFLAAPPGGAPTSETRIAAGDSWGASPRIGAALDAAGDLWIAASARRSDAASDAFVARFGPDAEARWERHGSGEGGRRIAASVAVAPGGAVVAGWFGGDDPAPQRTITFPGASALVSAGRKDGWMARFADDGRVVWARRAGGSGDDAIADVSVGADGRIFAAGSFDATAAFGEAEPRATTLRSAGGGDAFVMRLAP